MPSVLCALAHNSILDPASELTLSQDPSARIGQGCRIGPSVVIGPDVTIEDGMTKHLIRRVKVWCLIVLKWWLTVLDQLTNCFHTWGACCRVNCRVQQNG